MTNYILMEGDKVQFMPNFVQAIVIVKPGSLKGSGPTTIGGKRICVQGDEKKLTVPGCAYVTTKHIIPGVGTLMIDSLAKDQIAQKTRVEGKAVLLKGKKFVSVFQVTNPAKQPPTGPGAPIPDTNPMYKGKGVFITANNKFKGK